jgi:hypothetical protein
LRLLQPSILSSTVPIARFTRRRHKSSFVIGTQPVLGADAAPLPPRRLPRFTFRVLALRHRRLRRLALEAFQSPSGRHFLDELVLEAPGALVRLDTLYSIALVVDAGLGLGLLPRFEGCDSDEAQ